MAYYVPPDSELTRQAIAVTASDEDPEYVAENLLAEDAARPAKLLTNDGWFLFEFAGPVSPVAVALIYQYLDQGLDVRIEGNSSSDFTSPDYSRDIVIPAKRRDGPSYQRWTTSPWLMLDDEPSYAFWRVYIAEENTQPVAIGRVFLAEAIHRVTLFHEGDISETDRPENDLGQIVHPTQLGVERIYTIGGPRRGINFTLIGTDLDAGTAPVQEAADFRALIESVDGREHPFLLIAYETNDAMLVRPESPAGGRSHRVGGYQVWSTAVREVSRGLPFP